MSPQRDLQTEKEELHEPPRPPRVDRGLELYRSQWIGMSIVALVPVLAMVGVFGERRAIVEVAGTSIAMRVEYPTRLRATLSWPLTVRIENRTAQRLDTVKVAFDSAYAARFADVDFIPAPDDAYVVTLTGVRPGEARRVRMQFRAERVGRHTGRIVARAQDESVTVGVITVVLP